MSKRAHFTLEVDRGLFRALAVLLVPSLLALSGCAAATPKAPDAPAKQAQKWDHEAEMPYHQAPPPAYGNKVVEADSDGEQPSQVASARAALSY